MNVISDDYSIILESGARNSFGFGLRKTGPGLIVIKNIMPKSSAHENGRMRVGDRVLAVNDQMITKNTNLQMVNDWILASKDTVKLMLSTTPTIPGTGMKILKLCLISASISWRRYILHF